jgi:hypothetical protein
VDKRLIDYYPPKMREQFERAAQERKQIRPPDILALIVFGIVIGTVLAEAFLLK